MACAADKLDADLAAEPDEAGPSALALSEHRKSQDSIYNIEDQTFKTSTKPVTGAPSRNFKKFTFPTVTATREAFFNAVMYQGGCEQVRHTTHMAMQYVPATCPHDEMTQGDVSMLHLAATQRVVPLPVIVP